jgi:sulfur carrier protein ThiS
VAVAVVALVTVRKVAVARQRTLQRLLQQQMVQTESAAVAVEVVPVVPELLVVKQVFKLLVVAVVVPAFSVWVARPVHLLRPLER